MVDVDAHHVASDDQRVDRNGEQGGRVLVTGAGEVADVGVVHVDFVDLGLAGRGVLVDVVAQQQELGGVRGRLVDVDVELDRVSRVVVENAATPVAVGSSARSVVVVVLGDDVGAARAATATGGEADVVEVSALEERAVVRLVDERDPHLRPPSGVTGVAERGEILADALETSGVGGGTVAGEAAAVVGDHPGQPVVIQLRGQPEVEVEAAGGHRGQVEGPGDGPRLGVLRGGAALTRGLAATGNAPDAVGARCLAIAAPPPVDGRRRVAVPDRPRRRRPGALEALRQDGPSGLRRPAGEPLGHLARQAQARLATLEDRRDDQRPIAGTNLILGSRQWRREHERQDD